MKRGQPCRWVGAIVMLLTGTVLTGCGLRFGASPTVSQTLETAALVPDQTLMATFVNTQPEAWERLEQLEVEQPQTLVAANLQDFALLAPLVTIQPQWWQQFARVGVPETQILISDHLQTLENHLLVKDNLSYGKDLAPWVEQMTVAILPPTQVRDPGQINALLLFRVTDATKAREFLTAVQAQEGVESQTIDYNGIPITEIIQGRKISYTAILGNYLLFSPERQSVELAIAASQNNTSLRQQPQATQVLTDASELDDSLAQIYIPDYANLINQILVASASTAPLSPEALAAFDQVQSLSAGINLEDQGLRFRVLITANPEAEMPPFRSVPGKALQFFPANTLALLSGQDLKSFWTEATAESPVSPESPLPPLQEFDFGFDLDMEKEVVSWMTGEFALGIIPVEQELMSQLGVSGAVVLETDDRTTAEKTLDKLDQQAEKTNLTIDKTSIADKTITQWRLPQGLFINPFENEVLLGYGWLKPDALFIALGGALVNTMTDSSQGSLVDSPDFQAVANALPKQNSGYFYVNLAAIEGLESQVAIDQQLDRLPEGVLPTLETIRSLGITTSQVDRQTRQVDLFMVLNEATPPPDQPPQQPE